MIPNYFKLKILSPTQYMITAVIEEWLDDVDTTKFKGGFNKITPSFTPFEDYEKKDFDYHIDNNNAFLIHEHVFAHPVTFAVRREASPMIATAQKFMKYLEIMSKINFQKKKMILVGTPSVAGALTKNLSVLLHKVTELTIPTAFTNERKINCYFHEEFKNSPEEVKIYDIPKVSCAYHLIPSIEDSKKFKQIACAQMVDEQLRFTYTSTNKKFVLENSKELIEFEKVKDVLIFTYENIMFIKYPELIKDIDVNSDFNLKLKDYILKFLFNE